MSTEPSSPASPTDSSFGDVTAHERLPVDQLLRALAHPCRREILCHLDAEPSWTREELASRLGTVEILDTHLSERDGKISLRHQHLPILADADVVDVDDSYDHIQRGKHFAALRVMVDAAVRSFE